MHVPARVTHVSVSYSHLGLMVQLVAQVEWGSKVHVCASTEGEESTQWCAQLHGTAEGDHGVDCAEQRTEVSVTCLTHTHTHTSTVSMAAYAPGGGWREAALLDV